MPELDDKARMEIRKLAERAIKAHNQAKADVLHACTPIKAARKAAMEGVIDKLQRMGIESRAACKKYLTQQIHIADAVSIRDKTDGEERGDFDDLILAYSGQLMLPVDLQPMKEPGAKTPAAKPRLVEQPEEDEAVA